MKRGLRGRGKGTIEQMLGMLNPACPPPAAPAAQLALLPSSRQIGWPIVQSTNTWNQPTLHRPGSTPSQPIRLQYFSRLAMMLRTSLVRTSSQRSSGHPSIALPRDLPQSATLMPRRDLSVGALQALDGPGEHRKVSFANLCRKSKQQQRHRGSPRTHEGKLAGCRR